MRFLEKNKQTKKQTKNQNKREYFFLTKVNTTIKTVHLCIIVKKKTKTKTKTKTQQSLR
jgi:hypothetical protein